MYNSLMNGRGGIKEKEQMFDDENQAERSWFSKLFFCFGNFRIKNNDKPASGNTFFMAKLIFGKNFKNFYFYSKRLDFLIYF